MAEISLTPHSNPFTQVYKYFYDKLKGKVTVKGVPVPFVFSKDNTEITYPCIYLDFVRKLPYTSDRYVGDDIKVKNLETGLFELVTIGEPYESIWVLVAECKDRDTLHEISPQIRAIMGRSGCIKDPFYIEHSRDNKSVKYDYYGDTSLMKRDDESLRFQEKIGYRTYLRFGGGIRLDTYNPRPPIEEIIFDLEIDSKVTEREVIN